MHIEVQRRGVMFEKCSALLCIRLLPGCLRKLEQLRLEGRERGLAFRFTFAFKDVSDLLFELLSCFFMYFLLAVLNSISCSW